MVVVKDVPLKMDDGATLFADVGYPADRTTGERAAGTFPVLLSQNPYPGGKPDDYFVSRGYIYAIVDVRGTGRTDAPPGQSLHFDLFSARQTKDGVELVDWAAHRLSGSNGVVGLTGCSYLGINQLFTAAAVGPHSPIAAILPACASNGYEIYFSGGIPTSIAGLFGGTGSIVGTKWIKQSQAWGTQLSSDIKAGGPAAYNRGFWLSRSTAPIIPDIVQNGIPALLWSGWRATELTGVLDEYAIFQNAYAGRAPFAAMPGDSAATGRYQVVIGSGEHAAGIDPAIELEWFDRWLKHDRNAIDETSTPMHLFEEQGDRWINAADYPLVPAYTPYYLGGDSFEPSKPAAGHSTIRWGPASASATSLTKTSEPFDKAVTLAGPIAVSISASSSNTNMELVATLDDVAPGGATTMITHGALLGSMRATDPATTWVDDHGAVIKPAHPFSHDVYLTPHKMERFDIGLLPTVWRVRPGHALRLTVSTQASADQCKISLANGLPQAWPCLFTEPQQRTLPGGRYAIDYGGAMPSSVALPIVDPALLATAVSGVTATSNEASVPLDWGKPAPAGATSSTTTTSDHHEGSDTSDSSPWPWIILAAVVAAAGIGIVGWTRRRRGVHSERGTTT
jgi:predicted acyl esterase